MKKYKLAAALVACMIAAAPFVSPTVKAEGGNYSQTIDSAQIQSYLVLKKGVPVPHVTIRYSLAPGKAVNGTQTTHEILAGQPGAVFSSGDTVVFSPSDTASDESSAPSGSTIQFATADTSDEAYVEKSLTVNLRNVIFPKAGIYRYVITETASSVAGLTRDSVNKRYLDVFVHKSDQTDNDTYVPGAFIVRLNDGLPDEEGKADTAIKSTGFTSRYTTYNLGFSKSVTGNQASFNQYFQFTVKLVGNQSEGDDITRVLVGNEMGYEPIEAYPTENMATEYDAPEMSNANNIPGYVTLSQLKAGKNFYLKNGQSVLLTGIPAGMDYVVTEAQKDYSPSVEVKGNKESTNTDSRSLTEDTSLQFVNTRIGDLPSTGISAAFALPVAVMLTGIAGIALLFARRIRRMKQNASEGNGIE